MLRNLAPIIILILALSVLFFAVTGNHGLLHLRQLNNELEVAGQSNRKLESDIIKLENEISAIKYDKRTLEKIAREELGLAKPGETVYIFDEKK